MFCAEKAKGFGMKHCAATLRGSGGNSTQRAATPRPLGELASLTGIARRAIFPSPPGGIPLMTIDDQKLVEQCEAGIKTLAGVDEWVRANPQAASNSSEGSGFYQGYVYRSGTYASPERLLSHEHFVLILSI